MSEIVGLERYGPFINRYTGNGHLYIDGIEDPVPCNLECGQIVNGRIICQCSLDSNAVSDPVLLAASSTAQHAREILGSTSDGFQLQATRLLFKRSSGLQITYYAGALSVLEQRDVKIVELKFRLTNFKFPLTLEWLLDEHFVRIERLENYDEAIDRLHTIGGAEITALMTVRPSKPIAIDKVDQATHIADDVSMLLTLARACSVQPLVFDAYSKDKRRVTSIHTDMKTTPYCSTPLIDPRNHNDTLEFIQQTFNVFRQKNELWELTRIIRQFIDANDQGGYLESRALKLAVLAESIKSSHARLNKKESILEEKLFNTGIDILKKRLHSSLVEVFPEALTEEIDRMVKHACELNRYSFGELLQGLITSLRLKVSSSDRYKFVNIRNPLVHEARFLHADENGNKRSDTEQWAFMLTFMGRIILAILEYRGHYFSWDLHVRGMSEQARLKMHYSESAEDAD